MDYQKLSTKLDFFKTSQEIEDQLDGLNVEDGLSAQDNETFLLASMAFLQQHAKRKLSVISETIEDDPQPTTTVVVAPNEYKRFKKHYSNMLLFESQPGDDGHKERFYLKLKDSEKYCNIIESETCVPKNSLSQEQILPKKVKNPKMLPRLFRSLPKIKSGKRNIDSLSPKSSIFSLFKHKHKKIRLDAEDIQQDRRPREEKQFGQDWSWQVSRKCHQCPPRPEELRMISELSLYNDHVTLTKSINQKFRRPESLTTVQQFLMEDNSPHSHKTRKKISKQQISHEYYYVDKRNRPKKVSRPLSKISVCYEEGSDSDKEEDSSNDDPHLEIKVTHPNVTKSQISGFSNISDELKANLSPEILQNIISEMILCLEDTPSCKGV